MGSVDSRYFFTIHYYLLLSKNPECVFSEEVKSKNPERFRIRDFWWGKVDSNHRSDKQQIYSLSPLATREFPQMFRSHRTRLL